MNGTDPAPARGAYPADGIAWQSVAMLALLYFFSYADRQILALLVTPIQHDLRITDVQFGLLIGTSFAVAFSVFGLIVARFVDRYSRKWIVAIGALLWTISTILSAFAGSFAELIILRIGLSIGEAVLSPAAISMIADLFPRERRAAPTSIYTAAAGVGGSGAFLYGGWLFKTLTATGLTLPVVGTLSAWRGSMLLIGVPGLLIAILFIVAVPEPMRLDPPSPGQRGASPLAEARHDWRAYMGYLGAFAVMAFTSMTLPAWYPTILVREFGLDVGTAGFCFGMVGLIFGPLGVLSVPFLLSRFGRWRGADALVSLGLTAIMLASPCVVLALLSPEVELALAALVPATFLLGICNTMAYMGIQQFAPGAVRGQFVSYYLLAYGICGLGLGPLTISLISAGTGVQLSSALAGCSVVGAILALALLILARTPIRARLADGAAA